MPTAMQGAYRSYTELFVTCPHCLNLWNKSIANVCWSCGKNTAGEKVQESWAEVTDRIARNMKERFGEENVDITS